MEEKNNTKRIAGISATAHYLPTSTRKSSEIEEMINAHLTPPIQQGSIERMTGIITRHVAGKDEYNSTMAIRACKKLFKQESISPTDIDLLIFASTGQDVLEPATAHIVQAEIGTLCPVLDVTNACNSFLNALEIAVSFIQTGKYISVLIATGEVPTRAAKYEIESRHVLNQYLPGYTFGDAGTAVLVDGRAKMAEVLDSSFFAESADWDVAMFPGGGSRFLDKRDAYFFSGDATKLMEPFFFHTKRLLGEFLTRNNITIEDVSHVFAHQVAEVFLKRLCEELSISESKVEVTIKKYGNVAAASLPLAFDQRLMRETPAKGSLGLMIGLAGGISIGFTLLKF